MLAESSLTKFGLKIQMRWVDWHILGPIIQTLDHCPQIETVHLSEVERESTSLTKRPYPSRCSHVEKPEKQLMSFRNFDRNFRSKLLRNYCQPRVSSEVR